MCVHVYINVLPHPWVVWSLDLTLPLLQPIEDALRHQILPSLTSSEAPTDIFRDLFSLPCLLGGLGFPNPVSVSSTQIPELCLFVSLLSIWLFHNVVRYTLTL